MADHTYISSRKHHDSLWGMLSNYPHFTDKEWEVEEMKQLAQLIESVARIWSWVCLTQ